MTDIKEMVSAELYRKACAERDAYKDLVERMAISLAVQRFGSIGAGKNVMVGNYVYHVFIDGNGIHAEVRG